MLLIQSDRFNRGDHNILTELSRTKEHVHNKLDECVRDRTCRDKLVACRRQAEKGTQQSELPARTVAYQQEQKQEGQPRHDLSSKQQLEQSSVKPTPASNKNKQTVACQQKRQKQKKEEPA